LLSAKQIPPGKTGEIEVDVKTEGAEGALNKSITVFSNDPRQPQIVLSVTAVVQPEFEYERSGLFFGSVPKGKEVTKELIITIPPGVNAKVISVESTDKNIAVSLQPVEGSDGRKVKLVATLKRDMTEGYKTGTVTVKTSSPHTPELKIAARAMITASGSN
jgi:hypothetical protein